MRPVKTKLHDDAVAQWENEGGTSQSSSKTDEEIGLLSVSPIVPPIASPISSDR